MYWSVKGFFVLSSSNLIFGLVLIFLNNHQKSLKNIENKRQIKWDAKTRNVQWNKT